MNPEGDILYQRRLRRRLEEARREAKFVSEQGSRQFQPPLSHIITSLAPPQHNRNMTWDIIHSDDQSTKDVHTLTTGIADPVPIPGIPVFTPPSSVVPSSSPALADVFPHQPASYGMGFTATGNGLGGGPILHPYPLSQAAVIKHEDKEKDIGPLTDLDGVVRDKYGGMKSPNSSPRVNVKDQIVQTDPT